MFVFRSATSQTLTASGVRSSRGKRILSSAMRLREALEMRKSVPVKQLAYLLSVDHSAPRERFFAAVLPRKFFLRVRTHP